MVFVFTYKTEPVTPHTISVKIGCNVSWQEYIEHCLDKDELPEEEESR